MAKGEGARFSRASAIGDDAKSGAKPTLGAAQTEDGVRPDYFGHRRRLRERFRKSGIDSFAAHEVVELVLTLAIPRSDVKPLARRLLTRFGDLRGILDATPEDLESIPGIGSVAPVALSIIKATSVVYLQQRTAETSQLADQAQLANFWRLRLGGLRNEVFEVAYLDSSYSLIHDGVERLEEGTVDRAAVYPRRVVEAALRRGAAVLVLAHNHPNSVVEPTEHDKVLTRAIVLAAETVQIRVLDHLVVSADDAFSFRKAGLL